MRQLGQAEIRQLPCYKTKQSDGLRRRLPNAIWSRPNLLLTKCLSVIRPRQKNGWYCCKMFECSSLTPMSSGLLMRLFRIP